MRLSLFSRLTLGYLTIFILVVAGGFFAIREFQGVRDRTRDIDNIDNRVLDYAKILSNSLERQRIAEQRFATTYPITKNRALYDRFLQLGEEFKLQIARAAMLRTPTTETVLENIKTDYQRYEKLVADEAELLRANKPYPQVEYQQEKDKTFDAMLAYLDSLRENHQRATQAKVKELAAATDQALNFFYVVTGACLVVLVLMSLLITRSITRPIGLLKSKTREIAAGRFEGNLKVGSPPEIAELAAAFNIMCERLNEIDRMKADFFASMAHELRSPLGNIKDGTGLLLDGVGGDTTDKQRKLLTILAEESNRLIGVVNSLLDLSKMEAGMMNYDFDTVSLDPLIKQAVGEFTPLVEAKQIDLQSAVEMPLPPVRLDPNRILQVLRNLIGNAVKFTPKGGSVRIAARPSNGKLEVSVKDSGPGIPAESLTAVFEKYNQGNLKGASKLQGTGLGLAIAKTIIQSHGGEIWAESQLGQGSTFVFVLPC